MSPNLVYGWGSANRNLMLESRLCARPPESFSHGPLPSGFSSKIENIREEQRDDRGYNDMQEEEGTESEGGQRAGTQEGAGREPSWPLQKLQLKRRDSKQQGETMKGIELHPWGYRRHCRLSSHPHPMAAPPGVEEHQQTVWHPQPGLG